jgi:hypothetical protein
METVVRLHNSRLRRAAKAQALQHIMPSFMLFSGGFHSIHEIPWLGVFELLAGGMMLVIAIMELKAKHHHEGGAVKWADLFAAAMLLGEAFHRAHAGGRYLPYAYVFISVMMAVRAYVAKSIEDRRRFVVNDEGFSFCRRFRKTELPWSAVKDVKVTERTIQIESIQGPVTLDLAHIDNRAEVIAAFQSMNPVH